MTGPMTGPLIPPIVADITSRESNTNLDTMYSYFYLVTTIYTITWGLEPIEP